jgi:hypothetical protein
MGPFLAILWLQVRPGRSSSSFSIKTCVEKKILGPFKFVKVPQREKYEKQDFLPCKVIIQMKEIF